jgi:uncharacterized protein
MRVTDFVLALAAALLLAGCPSTKAPASPASGPAVDLPRVVLPDGFEVAVEIAADDYARARGLMYRESLPVGRGMLFIFPEPGIYPFWMMNTMIPLDIIWIEAGGRVVHVEEGVPPCRTEICPNYPPSAEATFVLELASGEAAAHRVRVGKRVGLPPLEQYRVR